MNLIDGKIADDKECAFVLEHLEERITATLQKTPPGIDAVIDACDRLVRSMDRFDLANGLPALGISPVLAEMYRKRIDRMFNAAAIRERLRIELGEDFDKPRELTYLHSGATAVQRIAPLGVLFHITAGNVDGLPFVSLLDGLLTGNINIIKLPKEEGGLTAILLKELLAVEPKLREYVYVFDYSSKDIHAMKKLARIADAVVVWGGDAAVSAIRRLVDPNTRIVEWGHKISFAYATKGGVDEASLEKLALHICLTNQLFCSACQGVFLDTDDLRDVYDFCELFLPVLERVSREHPFEKSAAVRLFVQAELTLRLYHRQIEDRETGDRIFRGKECSVTAHSDSRLETAGMYRNIWVKPLKRDALLRTLRPYKNYLQTAALLCADGEYGELSRSLLQAGLVKISDGFEMSNYAFGEAHDGVFALRCYTKSVSVQNRGGTI